MERIISGGQTGVDRAALDVALALGIPCGGWCPRGRKAEDGRIPDRYPLVETKSTGYSERTIRNVDASNGTLILAAGQLTGGTLLTKNTALGRKLPCIVLDPESAASIDAARAWLIEHRIRVLNVAGPRAGRSARTYERASRFLFGILAASTVGRPPARSRAQLPARAGSRSPAPTRTTQQPTKRRNGKP